ncbi:O-linked N-acetylglucosamine transferase, SPINDLY family protein [Fischerella thermalis CCMEE 5201]|jgi:predicted O-linked N-acetylglucosamine transferase (SPINDLY family)|nr:O-linked N-acetylglucosamine transferase, SPINDLY family protein [Fischerella thermalis CCMEE 5201]
MPSLNISTKPHQRAEEYFYSGNYLQAANLYEKAIVAEPDVKSHYWHLGLMLLLQGQEVEAQTTWFLTMMEGESEQVELWNAELVKILQTEAERQEGLEENSISWKIRQQIKEIAPADINNLLHLVQLAIKLNTYTPDELTEQGIVEILQSQQQVEVDLHLLMQVLRSVLNYAPLHPSSLELAEVCIAYARNNIQAFLGVILPASIEIAYSHRQPGIAAQLSELYLPLDPENTELLGHLASFYQNYGDFDKGIETAKLFYSLVEELPDKIFANRQILRGIMSAGGYWEESLVTGKVQESLLTSLIEQKPTQLEQIKILRLFNAHYFAPYLEDEPRKNRFIQNKLLEICQINNALYAKEHLDKYQQGHIDRKTNIKTDRKLKIGYLSYCLRSHSVGWLARWLFKHHDRDKFQLYGYFINTNPQLDALHEWYICQVDKAYKSNNVYSIAEEIYQDQIDILIDLDSITLDTTCEVLALKPAPIQATWLGWDASGSPAIDYFIADPYVLPESAQEYYKEKIWRLPQTYIAVDGFEISVPTLRRHDLDLPSDAVVYFSGQRGFKRHPETTRMQLRIIKEVPNSYFLIKGTADEKSIKNFFYKLAEEEGVDCFKLRFLPDVPLEAIHRANLGIADIVLDTYPYNGATTTMETLWMCIPLVTRVGEQFAARNSYTMMINAGITEGIAWTDEEYVEWGVRLGKDVNLRQQIAWKLRQSQQTAPLWNGKQFTREMEKAYEQMWQNYMEGL